MKKLLAILCAAMLLVTFCIPVFAAGEGSITINNAVVGQTYNVYKLLDLTSYDPVTGAYLYAFDSDWSDFFTTGEGKDYLEINEGIATLKAGKTAADLAKVAIKYAKDTGKPIDATADAASTTLSITNLDLGYYLVDSSLGALCSLNTTKPNAVIEEKNEKPSINKVANSDSVSIGQTITYTITVTVQKGAVNYIVHDRMSDGLTYKGITSVKIGAADVAAANYTVTTNVDHDPDPDCTFEVAFDNAFIGSLAAGTKIDIVYTAVVNDKAVVNNPHTNTAELEYGDHGDTTYTDEITVSASIYAFDLVKVDGADNKLLDGAQFELYDTKGTAETTDDVLVEFVTVAGGYRVADEDELGSAVTTMTVSDGKITVTGLGKGDYYLKETKAPTGYNPLPGTQNVTIDGTDYSATITDGKWTSGGVKVENNTGTVLPSTGGIGTTLFLLIGGGLVLCTGILLVTKKRMDKIAD